LEHVSVMITTQDTLNDNLETPSLTGKANWLVVLYIIWVQGLSKAVKVRYEKGVLKPLEPVDLREGEERIAVLVPVGEERRKILRRYRGILGKASEEEIEELLAEAEWEPL